MHNSQPYMYFYVYVCTGMDLLAQMDEGSEESGIHLAIRELDDSFIPLCLIEFILQNSNTNTYAFQ